MEKQFVILSDNADTLGIWPREVFEKATGSKIITEWIYSPTLGYDVQVEYVTISDVEKLNRLIK